MATPSGKLIFTSYESRGGSKTRLYIFGAVFVVGVLMTIFGTKSALPLIGIPLALIGAGFSLITLPHALRREHTLELYDDGFIWRTTNDQSVKQSALWAEVPDVTLPKDGPNGIGLAEGGKAFGLAGIALGAAADSLFNSANNKALAKQVLIMLPNQRGRAIMVDDSYSESYKAQDTLRKITRDAWVSELNAALAAGRAVLYGKLTLTDKGFSAGKRAAAWENVNKADWSEELKSVFIAYRGANDKHEQRHTEKLGYRGYALIDFVKQKIGEKESALGGEA